MFNKKQITVIKQTVRWKDRPRRQRARDHKARLRLGLPEELGQGSKDFHRPPWFEDPPAGLEDLYKPSSIGPMACRFEGTLKDTNIY